MLWQLFILIDFKRDYIVVFQRLWEGGSSVFLTAVTLKRKISHVAKCFVVILYWLTHDQGAACLFLFYWCSFFIFPGTNYMAKYSKPFFTQKIFN